MASNLFFPISLLIFLTSSYCSPAIAGGEEAAELPCVKELLPCQQYLHESKPPEQCCLPLLSAIRKEAACLCAVFYSEPILKALNLTQEEALHLPRSCGGNVPDLGKCENIGGGGGGGGDTVFGPTQSPPTLTPALAPPAPAKLLPPSNDGPTPSPPSPAKPSPPSNGSSPSSASIGNSIASACPPIFAGVIASVAILAFI